MFRFTIRDMLWLTVVVAVGLSSGIAYYRLWLENQHLKAMDVHQESTIESLTSAVKGLLTAKQSVNPTTTPNRP